MDNSPNDDKKRNPVEKANLISYLTFLYMFPIFKRGYKNGLSEDDLYRPLDEHKSSILGEKLEKIWKEEYRKQSKFGLYKALFKLFGFNFIMMGIVRLVNEVVLVVAMPLAIGKLVAYFETGQTLISEYEAYSCAAIIVFCRLADPFLSHGSMMGLMHIAMKMRIACCALIYRKILRLKMTSLADTTIGQLINLLSNDVSRFDDGFILANFVWIAPIQAAVGTYLLYNEIGVSAFYGMALILLFVPLQIWLGKKNSGFTLKIAQQTDKRVRLMNEIISGIHVIKMYCWEKPFEKLISVVRRCEMKAIRNRSCLLGLIFCFEMFITRVSIFASVLGYVIFGNSLSARQIFAVTAIYAVLRPIITTIFSFGINSIGEVYVSVKRIQNFLSLEEQEDLQLNLNGSGEKIEKPRILLKNVSAKWNQNALDSTLSDINLEINSNQLVAVIGAVGSGKSSLINVLLRELSIENGSVSITGKISYASQEPWLFSGSVRQNILFGDDFDQERYTQVLKICALEADLKSLPFGDRTLVGEKGKALSGGQKARINLARCIYKNADIYLLDDPLSAVDAKVGRHLYEKCIKEFLHDKICVLVTHQLQYLNNADKILVLEDGLIKFEGNFSELQNSGLDFMQMMAHFHQDEDLEEIKEKKFITSKSVDEDAQEDEPLLEKEKMSSGNVKFSLYWLYFKAGGGFWNAFLMLTVFIGAQVVASASDYFVTYWVNTEEKYKENLMQNFSDFNETFPRDTLLYTYSAIILAVFIFGIVHGIYFMLFFSIASVTLHNLSFSRIMKATMRFFNFNPSGRILNRFSKDLGCIDLHIPPVIYDVIAVALDLFGAIILSVIVDYWLCLPSVFLLVLFYTFRKLYLQTSRSVKRLEGINRSPIYSHMSASIYGLSTIRAFSAQRTLTKEFDEYQDKHSAAFYMFLASNRCFGFWIDATSAIFIAAAIFILLQFRQNLQGGDIGLVITQFIGLAGGLQWGMRQWSEMENQMVSVERLIEYTELEIDPDRKDQALPQNWPDSGRIEFQNVSLSYHPDEAPVLKNLNFVIQAREKIGIVGRTGAGKTSIITALFQLYPIEGCVLIDGVDTTKLSLESLRSTISIIPQEPVLFSGTMRKNLDPFDEYSDDVLWNALEQVEMKEEVEELPHNLHSIVAEGGTNFSVGQRQLICLARALIRNNKILVMDEATANVDHYTDSLIQQTIRKKFADCTVLTIAHRLHTVMDSDRILVMSSGRVEEFDHPYLLLQNKEGHLFNLVQTTGKNTAFNLENVARENYMQRKQQ